MFRGQRANRRRVVPHFNAIRAGEFGLFEDVAEFIDVALERKDPVSDHV